MKELNKQTVLELKQIYADLLVSNSKQNYYLRQELIKYRYHFSIEQYRNLNLAISLQDISSPIKLSWDIIKELEVLVLKESIKNKDKLNDLIIIPFSKTYFVIISKNIKILDSRLKVIKYLSNKQIRQIGIN